MLEKIAVWLELEEIRKQDFVSKLFDLTETETAAYFAILRIPLDVQETAKLVEKDRTTVQRILAKLVEKELAQRIKVKKQEGGVKYKYIATPFTDVKTKMIKKIDTWHSLTKDVIYQL